MVTTADSLISKVVRATGWPTVEENRPRTNAQILGIADDRVLATVWPDVIALTPDYYICTLDYTLVAGYSRYRLPQRLFGPIRDVLSLDSNGAELNSTLIDLEDLGRLAALSCGPQYHFVDGDYLGLEPAPVAGVTGSVRIRYFRAPSTLALSATCTTITAVDLESDPLAFTLDDGSVFAEGDLVDIISAGNAHMVLAEDVVLDTLAGDSAVAAATLLGSGIQAGDYVAPAGTTPILQVPDHAVPWLVALVAAEALERSDPEASAAETRKADGLRRAMEKIASPRTLSEPMTVSDPMSPWGLYR